MADIVTRAEWGARAPKGTYSTLGSTKGTKVHYTGGRVDPRIIDDHDRCVELVRDIQAFHMDGHGWIDIGYSLVACPHRLVFTGRGPHRLPAANGPGLNTGHYAVLALVGNEGLVQPSDEQLHAILDAIDYLRAQGGAGHEIKGHRDGYSTDCPGGPLYSWIQRGAPRPGGTTTRPAASAMQPKPGTRAPAWPGRLLRYPPLTRGADVYTWQRQAKKLGYDLDIDGAYGPQSRGVCRRLQRAHGLDDDGIVGPLTWKATFAR
ncbi:peptidoglycan recognition protein family protein [Sphaerimonospora thailandensis]|uniref:N-acetylmuramoyl-L-alanine amidase n=1 Tax=Sphaerimonospora thailandensis TaxID=795644 RepID=A0A8J3R8N3_9ACTN|nr:peptidoglycan-binding domain-containing protein [Sphaerimonospora thailandensis]GIH69429.1 N-acetylmuramoyl-L-alanine amidase [Sphaerimonospora thailandensis]